MDFLFDLAEANYRNQVFYTSGVWRKPPNITMVSFFLVGAGGAGGNGFVTSLLQGCGAGAGGGSGAITKLIIPAVLLPDILLVNVGVGGIRGTFGGPGVTVSGGSGTATYVDLINGNATASTLIAIANGGIGGGGGIVGGVAGTGGAAGAASTITSTVYLGMGLSSFYAGQDGQTATVTGTLPPVSTGTNLTSGGAGASGRGASPAGNRGTPGSIDGNDVYLPTLSISNSATTYDGQNGVNCLSPFQSYGGVGGWPATLAVGECGGNGGNGILGSGGGGGGAGNNGCPEGGLGGNGGNGYALITCY